MNNCLDKLKWFTSYLSGWQQLVCIGSDKSSPTSVLFGTLQGSVLGPLLLTAYISPFGDIIKKFGLDYHLYADDVQFYVSFCPGADDQLNAIVFVVALKKLGNGRGPIY